MYKTCIANIIHTKQTHEFNIKTIIFNAFNKNVVNIFKAMWYRYYYY